MLFKETVTFVTTIATEVARTTDISNKQGIFQNCAPLTDFIAEINNTKVDNEKDLDLVMRMYNFI